MVKISERLSQLFKSSAEARIAHDFLERKLRSAPSWETEDPVAALGALALAERDPERLGAWCGEWLSDEQIQVLRRALRMAAQHQRVYKRTVMLSPRAHLLVKTLSELEGLNMSDAIERHLERVIGERHGMMLRTMIDEGSGQVDHDILPAAAGGK